MRRMAVGEQIRILTDKWSVTRDLGAFARMTDNAVLSVEPAEGPADSWWVVMEKRSATFVVRDRPG